MEKARLGRTNLEVARSGFGALPLQRISQEKAVVLLRKAYERGINFFDTARRYRDSEEKIGSALAAVRPKIILATKTTARDGRTLMADLETSLQELRTDYIDVYQLHDPKQSFTDPVMSGLCEALIRAKEKGMIRYFGFTSHKLTMAVQAVQSGFFDTVQFPLSSLSSSTDLGLIEICRQEDVGLLAMKPLAGGLLTSAASAFAFLRQFRNVVPLWGIQEEWELDEFVSLEANPPALDEELRRIMEQDRVELAGSFCRGCGYCLPCPVDIPIPTAARLSLFLKKTKPDRWLSDGWKVQMERISQCLECGQCQAQCPYDLDTPQLLQEMLKVYRDFCATVSS